MARILWSKPYPVSPEATPTPWSAAWSAPGMICSE